MTLQADRPSTPNGLGAAHVAPSPEWYAAMSRELVALDDVDVAYQRLVEHARVAVAVADHCGATARRKRGRLESVASSDETARTCDAVQHELRQGPCVDAALDDDHYLVRDTETEQRWPDWCAKVQGVGVRSVLSLQLRSDVLPRSHEPLGAINLYAAVPDAFDDGSVTAGLVVASHVAQALATIVALQGLTESVEARHLVGVAQGILRARFGLDLDQSFGLLRRISNDHNLKLRDVAQRVVDEGALPAAFMPEEPPA